jgi:hypothetical protein
MTKANYEAGKKAEYAKSRSGFAPSEASEKELKAHTSDKGVVAAMAVRKTASDIAANASRYTTKKPLGDTGMSVSPFAIKSSTAGTTPKGLQPARSSTVTNTSYLGSGPSPLAVNNSMKTKKKTSLG